MTARLHARVTSHLRTMPMISFFVPGIPKGQPRPRAFAFHGKARVFDPGTAEGWKSQVALAANPHLPKAPMDGPIEANLIFFFPRPKAHFKGKAQTLREDAPAWHKAKPDADNLAKAVLDALTTLGIWEDDAAVCCLRVVKLYRSHSPGCDIEIRTAEELR